ncbi:MULTISPECIES: HAD family hydrolase [Actinomadura]|uniref:HAD family hydrolase n=1 Tax=Actinomadura yumaensis TaxID=111807 RepID=A0ABW2CG06_9ACTN|nr:HAD family phosphatase [Actinomadura sp. J1-007]MWK35652.1 HAD-IA family hydrolase [Actinomadura sp. J1-007]
MRRALFFDFDGVICDTERAANRSWQELYARLGLEFPATVWAAMAGHANGHDVAMADAAARIGRPLTGDEIAWRLERKQRLADEEPVRPCIAVILAAAARSDRYLAVVSSSREPWVGGHLDRLGLRDGFDLIVTGDGRIPSKPAPDLYLHALARSGLAREAITVIEDSPPGVAAARAAGLRCVAVPNAVTGAAGLGAADAVLDPGAIDLAAVDLVEVIA